MLDSPNMTGTTLEPQDRETGSLAIVMYMLIFFGTKAIYFTKVVEKEDSYGGLVQEINPSQSVYLRLCDLDVGGASRYLPSIFPFSRHGMSRSAIHCSWRRGR